MDYNFNSEYLVKYYPLDDPNFKNYMTELKGTYTSDISYITSISTVNFITDLGSINSAGNDYGGTEYVPVLISGTSINTLSLSSSMTDWTLDFNYYSKANEDKNPLLSFSSFFSIKITAATNKLSFVESSGSSYSISGVNCIYANTLYQVVF